MRVLITVNGYRRHRTEKELKTESGKNLYLSIMFHSIVLMCEEWALRVECKVGSEAWPKGLEAGLEGS